MTGQQITTAEELDALPVGSVVVEGQGPVMTDRAAELARTLRLPLDLIQRLIAKGAIR